VCAEFGFQRVDRLLLRVDDGRLRSEEEEEEEESEEEEEEGDERG
jgi:hypothetical protein